MRMMPVKSGRMIILMGLNSSCFLFTVPMQVMNRMSIVVSLW